MRRIQFAKGKQRTYLQQIQKELQTPTLKELLNYGISTNYSTLKNYYTEKRTLPETLYKELQELTKNRIITEHQYKKQHWGQEKGGKKTRKNLKRKTNTTKTKAL
jgi:hypothetical protein